MLNKKTEKA